MHDAATAVRAASSHHEYEYYYDMTVLVNAGQKESRALPELLNKVSTHTHKPFCYHDVDTIKVGEGCHTIPIRSSQHHVHTTRAVLVPPPRPASHGPHEVSHL